VDPVASAETAIFRTPVRKKVLVDCYLCCTLRVVEKERREETAVGVPMTAAICGPANELPAWIVFNPGRLIVLQAMSSGRRVRRRLLAGSTNPVNGLDQLDQAIDAVSVGQARRRLWLDVAVVISVSGAAEASPFIDARRRRARNSHEPADISPASLASTLVCAPGAPALVP